MSYVDLAGWPLNWVLLVGLVAGVVALGRLRGLNTPAESSDSPDGASRLARVAVVIPARNEILSIAGVLTDLAPSIGRGARVIVVDDGSSDGTAAAAAAFDGVDVFDAGERPAGWLGKPWACALGAQQAIDDGAETLVFIDADVRFADDSLAEIVAEHRHTSAAVSVQPFHVVPTMTEQLSAVFNLVSLMGTGAGTDRPSALFGPVICCNVADYERIGGHGSVRGTVTEDLALSREFERAGVPLTVLAGDSAVSFRMYPAGFTSLVEGWTKNMAIGATSVPIWRTALVAWFITALLVGGSAPLRWATGALSPEVAGAEYLATAAVFGLLARRVGGFRWSAVVFFIIPTLFFVAVFLRSVWKTFARGTVHWKGRDIEVTSSRRSDSVVEGSGHH